MKPINKQTRILPLTSPKRRSNEPRAANKGMKMKMAANDFRVPASNMEGA
jgi:hypothetical protein